MSTITELRRETRDTPRMARPPPPPPNEDTRDALARLDEVAETEDFHDGWSQIRVRRLLMSAGADVKVTDLNREIWKLTKERDALVGDTAQRTLAR